MKLHCLGRAVLTGLLVLFLGYSMGHAEVLCVNTFDDTNDFSCGGFVVVDGNCEEEINPVGDCSLREAIIVANANPGIDVIDLPVGTYTLNREGSGEDETLTGDLDITDDLNIIGAGSTQTFIDGNDIDRIFHIAPDGQTVFVSLFGMSLQNGLTPNISATPEEAAGGGILNKGHLSLTDVLIKENEAAFTGTGGGLHNIGNTAMFRSEVSGNRASKGGGIYNEGSMEILVSTVSANTTSFVVFDSSGGGIFNQGFLSVEDSTIFDNIASGLDGGGIYNNNLLRLTNSTVDNNRTTYGDGGGIYNAHEVTLSNVTITNNDAPGGFGGGILNDGTVNIGNSLLADNMVANLASNCLSGMEIISHGYNLEDIDSCNFRSMGDQFNTEPLLLSRGLNGGFTPTRGLQATSPAVDSGNPTGCLDLADDTPLITDQRALPRPVDGDLNEVETCDIGAFEYKSTRPSGADLAVRIAAVVNPLSVGDTATYQTTFFNIGSDTATNTQVTIALPATFNVGSIHTSQGSCDMVLLPEIPLKNLDCSLGTLPEGVSGTIIFSGQPGSGAETAITASITSDQPDNVPDNNSSSTVLFEDSLKLTSPNGGEVLQSGSTHKIQWTAPEEATRFKLQYSVDNGASWTRIDVVRNATSYNWSVPDVTLSRQNSRVKVIAFNAEGKRLGVDSSDEKFTIAPHAPQGSVVVSPNGGEVFYGDTPVLLKWTSASEAVSYRIKLSINNGKSWSFLDEVENATQTLWTVPKLAGDYTSCLIKLTAVNAGGQKLSVDVSDATFSILQPVQVTSPNGGETIAQGERITIQWEALPTATRFDVSYSMNNGADWTPIDTIENNHELSWIVPSVSSTQQNCLVKVVAFDASNVNLAEDSSDKTFTITGPIPSIVVTSPSSGAEIPYGEFVNISWETHNISTEIGQILVEYSLDRGRSWSRVKTLGPDEISYDWRPPPVPADVSTCKVKVTLLDLAGQEILSDKNSGIFTLLKAARDPWNYFPFEQGSSWSYNVTETENGFVVGTYPKDIEVTGNALRLGVLTTIFRSSAQGQTNDNYLFKSNNAITNYGTQPADTVTRKLIPYDEGRFPLIVGESFVQIDEKGVNLGEDLDFDGRNERVDIKSVVSVKKYQEVTVPAGTFPDCVFIKTVITMTVTLTSNGQQVSATGNGRMWAAPGVGPVKSKLKTIVKLNGSKDVSVITEELLDYSIPRPPS